MRRKWQNLGMSDRIVVGEVAIYVAFQRDFFDHPPYRSKPYWLVMVDRKNSDGTCEILSGKKHSGPYAAREEAEEFADTLEPLVVLAREGE